MLLATLTGCTDEKLSLGQRCGMNSQCPAPLVCRLDYCRKECNTTRDCAAGLSCVRDKQGLGACQLPPERSCVRDSDCIEGLVCRLGQCVNECAANIDCPAGARCLLDDATGQRGCLDMAEQACVRSSECAVFEGREQICAIDGRCRDECRGDRDCRFGTLCCNDAVCREVCPGGGLDAGPPPPVDAGVDAGPSGSILTHRWSRGYGGSTSDDGFAIALDSAGNIYVAGMFGNATGGSLDLGGGALVSAGAQDVFVASFDATGTHRWSQRFGGTGIERVDGISLAGGGNLTIVGFTQSSGLDFGGGSLTGETTMGDGFVATFDTGGAYVWSQRFGAAGLDEMWGVAGDASGNVYVTGGMQGTVDLGGGPLSAPGTAISVASYDGAGVHRWSRTFPTTVGFGAAAAADDGGLVVVTGNYRGTIDFGGGPRGSSNADVFLAAFDATSGTRAWSTGFGGSLRDNGIGIAMDAMGNATLYASIDGAVDFGGGALAGSGERLAVASFDMTGAHRWSLALPAVALRLPHGLTLPGISTDPTGNVYVTGTFMGSSDFGGGPLSNAGSNDVFVVSYSAMGAFRWADSFGGASVDVGRGVVIAPSGDVTLLATFGGDASFDGAPLTSAGSTDFALAQYGQPR